MTSFYNTNTVINVTNFFSIPYYRSVRLISKMYLEQNSCSITLDIHASTNKRPPHLFRFKPHSANKVFRIEVQEPYPLSNGGQNLGPLGVLPYSDRYINTIQHVESVFN